MSLVPILTNGLGEKERGKKKKNKPEERGKVWDFRERSSTFSLEFPAIRPAGSDEARSKVAPHGKEYTWVPDLGSLDKLQKNVGVFLLLALLFA